MHNLGSQYKNIVILTNLISARMCSMSSDELACSLMAAMSTPKYLEIELKDPHHNFHSKNKYGYWSQMITTKTKDSSASKYYIHISHI